MFTFFKKAGATGRVFLVGGGKTQDKGRAYSGLVGPWTTVAVVPETPQILNFEIDALTDDQQAVVVQGSVTITLVAVAVSKLDFTVDKRSGSYVGDWQKILPAKVTAHVLRVVLDTVQELDIETAIGSQRLVEEAVIKVLRDTDLAHDGIIVDSCSIRKVEPSEDEVGEAIGAKQREELLTGADAARHARRLKALEGDRALKAYEAETARTLEEDRAALIAQQGKNEEAKARADAEATRIRLAPLQEVEAGKLLGAAVMKAAETGRLGTLNLTSEFLAAAGQK